MTSIRRYSKTGLAVAGVATAAGLTLTGVGVYAGLNATAYNTTAQAASSATLKLTLADSGSGFTTPVSNLVPGDVINRYVDLTNGGTSAAQALTIGVADAAPTKLDNDATNGLQVTISACSVAWTVASNVGTCSGTTTSALGATSLSALRTTAASLLGGSASMTSLAVQHLQFSISLPNQNETTTNGTLPTGTIQGLSSNLTWTFTEAQRTAATTTS